MKLCFFCLKPVHPCFCDEIGNDDLAYDPNIIVVPSDAVLCQASTVQRLAIAYASLSLSRRSIIDFVADQIFGFFAFTGVIVTSDGYEIDIMTIDVDETFRTDDDPSDRWMSDFLNFAVTAPRQRAQRRVRQRLRLLWIALAIRHRRIAELVAR